MSISSVNVIQGRIDSATEFSKIAVFKATNSDGERVLDAVFDGTVRTKSRILSDRENYVGSFFKAPSKKEVLSKLKEAAKAE